MRFPFVSHILYLNHRLKTLSLLTWCPNTMMVEGHITYQFSSSCVSMSSFEQCVRENLCWCHVIIIVMPSFHVVSSGWCHMSPKTSPHGHPKTSNMSDTCHPSIWPCFICHVILQSYHINANWTSIYLCNLTPQKLCQGLPPINRYSLHILLCGHQLD